MNKQFTFLRTGFIILLLGTGLIAHGQIQTAPGPIDPLGPQDIIVESENNRGDLFDPVITDFSAEVPNSILFYNPDSPNGLTLKASKIEDDAANRGLEFTSYKWYYDGQDGTPSTTALSETSNLLAVTDRLPGYHYYRVEGYIIPPGSDPAVVCPPDASETFVVYVLPPLSVASTSTGTGLQYCEADATAQEVVQLTANIGFDGYTGSPNVEDFEFKYTWYSVKSNVPGNVFANTAADFPTIDVTKNNMTGAQEQDVQYAISNSNAFTPRIDDIGTYKFFVEVEYTIKDRHYDGQSDTETSRVRTYVIYRGWVGGEDQTNAAVVYVTPKPGKPHITIEAVND